MKKFLGFVAALVLLSGACFAQKAVASFKSETTQKTSDTLVNATTKYQRLSVTKPADVLSIQVTATKITGTTAGVIRLFGSNDGEAWVRVKDGAALAAGDSLNLSNVSTPQTILFTDKPSRFLYYRVGFVGSGTQSTRFKTTAVASK